MTLHSSLHLRNDVKPIHCCSVHSGWAITALAGVWRRLCCFAGCVQKEDLLLTLLRYDACLDGAEVSMSGWELGGPRFQSHPRLTFQLYSPYQLINQLESKPHQNQPSKSRILAGYQLLDFTLFFTLRMQPFQNCCKWSATYILACSVAYSGGLPLSKKLSIWP